MKIVHPKYLAVLVLIASFLFAPTFMSAAIAQDDSGVQVLEALVIEGKLQKPQVFYVLSRHKTKYKALELRRSFIKEIRRSLQRNPF